MTSIASAAHGLLAFLNIGKLEIVLIVVAILLLFGGKKLPELARGLGKGLREFKKGITGAKEELEKVENEDKDDEPSETKQKDEDKNAEEEDK